MKRIQFENGVTVEVEDHATDTDIDEIYSQVSSQGKSKAMQGLEAIEPSSPTMPERSPGILERIAAPIETGVSLLASPLTGIGNIAGAVSDVTGIGDPEKVIKSINQWVPAPTTELGKEYSEKVAKAIDPLNAIMPNLSMMHALGTPILNRPPLEKITKDRKLDAAKAESEALKVGEEAKKQAATPLEYDPGFAEGSLAKEYAALEMPAVEFPLQPKTPIRPLYNERESVAPVRETLSDPTPTIPGVEVAKEPLLTPEGKRVSGMNTGETSLIDPVRIEELWNNLKPETKGKFQSIDEFQTFVELHEKAHDTILPKEGESPLSVDRRINNKLMEDEIPRLRESQKPIPEDASRMTAADFEKMFADEAEARAASMHPDQKLIEGMDMYDKPTTEAIGESEIQARLALEDPTLDPTISRKDWLDQAKNNHDANRGKITRDAGVEPTPNTSLIGTGKFRKGNKESGGVNFGFSEKVVDTVKKFFDKTPSLKNFAEHLERDVADPVVKELYNKYYGKEIKDATPEQIAIARIPGLKETISPELQPLETMKERWKTESDLSSTPTARALRENLSSGGRMTAARTGNSFIDWNVENILGETRKAQVTIKTLQNKIRGEVNKITGGLMSELRGKSEGTQIFIESMNALLKSEGKNELPQGVHPEAAKLATVLRSTLDDLGRKIQAELTAQGIEGFKWRPNYLAGVFFGPYRSLVKDTTGKTIGVVAGRTKAEATAALDFVKNKMPDVSFDLVEYNPKWDQGPGSLGARYGKASEVLELLKNQDESAQLLQENLSAYYTKVQDNYMGYKQHFKKKTGVFGSEGSRPWENARNNAFDLLEAQLGIIDHGYHWLAEQKIMKDMDSILTDSSIALPESKRYVTQYLDHAFGRTEDMVKIFSKAQDHAAQMLGISPSAFREMSSILRNTALTGTLGVSGGFVLTQFVQVPQALAVGFGRALDAGVTGGSRAGSAMLGGMDLVNGIAGKFENMSKEGRYFFDYFTKNGVMDPHLVEHTIHRKIVTTTGMSPVQKAIWGSVNGAFKGAEGISGLIGKYSIERPEAWTRGTFAMTMAHYYKSAGYSLKEAVIRADKDTSVLFVDYSSQERAMAFQRMGELGKFASTVSTFKMNNLNQWFTFSNKKMYTALAALALTSWFTTGMFGMPGGDEAEFGATWLKSKGVDIETPREFMLRESPEWLSFGPLSSVPKWLGEAAGNPNVPGTALHRKFSQDNVIPDDLASFIYPLASFYTNKIKTGSDWVKSGFGKQEGAVFARELVPGNLKYGVDYLGLTNEKGLTVDPNQIHDVSPAHYDRTKQEWKLAAALGVVSQREFANKQIRQLDKMSEMAWKESTKSKVASTISAFDNKDKEKFQKLATEAVKYNPGAAEEIAKYINGRALANNIPMDKMMEMQFATQANSPHGVKRLQQFQQFKENRQ